MLALLPNVVGTIINNTLQRRKPRQKEVKVVGGGGLGSYSRIYALNCYVILSLSTFFIEKHTNCIFLKMLVARDIRYQQIPECCWIYWTSLITPSVKNLPAMEEARVRFLGQDDPLKEELATLSTILTWRIPWTEEPGRLQPTGLQSWTPPTLGVVDSWWPTKPPPPTLNTMK